MNQDINLQENKTIRTIYEKLQENKKIVEDCNKRRAEISEAVASLESAEKISKEKYDAIKEQADKLEEEIETQEKALALFENGNDEMAQEIAEKRKNLADLKASTVVNYTALKAYNKKILDLLADDTELMTMKNDALDMIENIAEIYDEKSERLGQRIEEIKADKDTITADAETLVPLVSRYAELNNRYNKLCSYGDIISDKKAAEKKAIAEEMEDIKETFGSKMPDFNKMLLESAGITIESKFELDSRRKDMAIQRQESRLKTLEKLAKQASDILKENDYVFDSQIHFYNENNNEKDNTTPEETKKDEAQVEYTRFEKTETNNYDYNTKNATYGLVEPLKEHKLPEEKPDEAKKDFEKDFENDYAFLFGDNIMNNTSEEQQVLPPFPKTEPPKPTGEEDTTKDYETEAKPEETTIEPPIDIFETAIAGEPRYYADSVKNTEKKKEEKTTEKKNNNLVLNDYLEELRKNSKSEEIEKKIKRKVPKEKKEFFVKRMWKKVENFFFEPMTEEEINQKGGRKR